MGLIGARYWAYRSTKWAISECERGHFATRHRGRRIAGKRKPLTDNHLRKPLKTRVFAAKSFAARNKWLNFELRVNIYAKPICGIVYLYIIVVGFTCCLSVDWRCATKYGGSAPVVMRRTGHRDADGGDVQADMKRTVRKHIPDGASTKICLICRMILKKVYTLFIEVYTICKRHKTDKNKCIRGLAVCYIFSADCDFYPLNYVNAKAFVSIIFCYKAYNGYLCRRFLLKKNINIDIPL